MLAHGEECRVDRYLISIDIGTQGTKAALLDEQLQVIGTSFEASRLLGEKAGEIWQEPDEIYGSCVRTVRNLMDKTGASPSCVEAIGVDSQMAGIMGIDKEGEASTCYDSWLDTRCSSYIKLLESEAGDEILTCSGGPVTGSHASKILWWKHQRPQQYEKTAAFVLPHGYVTGKMVGNKADKAVFDHTCLHFNNFSDNEKKQWNEGLMTHFGIESEKLPRIVSPFEIIGTTTERFAKEADLISGIPVTAGLGDSAASTFGSGMFETGMLLDCAGTASILCSVVDAYVPDRKNKTLVMMRSPMEGLWLPLSYIAGGGLCIRWLRDQLTGEPAMSYEELEEMARRIPAGCNGLLFNPHFSGRVLPPEPGMKGAFLGLDFNHTKADMYRAVLESIACEYAIYLEILRDLFHKENFEKLNVVGGGSKSRLLNQIKADVLEIQVQTCETGETALIGSAAVAGAAVGLLKDYKGKIKSAIAGKDCYIPEPHNSEIYRKKIIRHRQMLKMLSGWKEEMEICGL